MVIHQFNRLIKNKWVWGVFAVAISVFFAFDFLFIGGDNEGRSSGSAGLLAGKDVAISYFSTLQDDVRGIGRGRDTHSSNVEVNRKAWQAAAALSVAKAAKLEASDAEVREAILRDPSFKDREGGSFNLRIYEYLLRENGMKPEMFEAYLKRRITLTKLAQVVLGSATWVSPVELEGEINDWTDKFTVRVATYSDNDFGNVKLDDKALEAYYKDNTNSIALPDCVTVKFVKFQADTPERLKMFTISDDEMHDHYDANINRFETKGTNGVTVTKKFEEVKGILEKELQLVASVEAYRTNLLFRLYPQDEKLAADNKTDRLEKIAAEEKAKVITSRPFALDGRGYVKGFMVYPSQVAPGCDGFAAAVAELDSDAPELRYGVVAASNCVYLIERDKFIKAHVPSFADAKEIIRADALQDAQVKAFKASVEKSRALAAAELAKGKPFDPNMMAATAVSTSLVFAVSAMQGNAFQDSMYVAQTAMRLNKGQLSEFVTTANHRRGIVVYVENREPGDAAQAQMARAQIRESLARPAAMALPTAWNTWNLDRLGYETTSISSVKDDDEITDSEE